MEDTEQEDESQRAAREESAVLRGWLRLADDVLKQPTAAEAAEEPLEEPLEEPAGDTPA